ncbi:MAG TPA: hypothetical protein VJ746_05200 [Nitrospira sp.]|nr:hypothetical protein [Nitrospira sp.]
MSKKFNISVDLAEAEARLQAWRKQHNTSARVAAAHRKVLLERVSQSMAFENQPISIARLKVLMTGQKKKAS